MDEKGLTTLQLQEARRYALCIAGDTNMFEPFAIAMIDYMGYDIIPHLKELYCEICQILFTRAIPTDDLRHIERIDDVEIRGWYERYSKGQEERERSEQEEFNENIDELQFLVEDFRKKEEFQKMLDFVGKFSHIAPYNAMLVEMQKPGSILVLKGKEWKDYGRFVKPNAQKLITLRQFGPVQCMFDISDTEPIPGIPLNDDAKILEMWNNSLKRTEGDVDEEELKTLIFNLPAYGIYLDDSFNASNTYGGYVMPYEHEISVPVNASESLRYKSRFLISVNRNQNRTEKFHTICHELGHIFCRHQSYDRKKTRGLSIKEREFEAETVAWLMCKRHGVNNASEEYLATYAPSGTIPLCSTDFIMKAVTEIEKMVQKKVYARKSEWYSEDKRFKDDLDFYMRSTKKKKNIKKTSKTTEIVY